MLDICVYANLFKIIIYMLNYVKPFFVKYV